MTAERIAEPITDLEYRTHVQPIALDNWFDAHGERHPSTDAEYDEAERWAAYLRESFDTGETPITWR